ncbi:hypothetical protein PRtIB026_A49500 [Pseudomonas sp. RtIB026]|uniref:hypothetical protein n=1 Tax=Pseudomonas sp. RtIB026 TaxID=2749999 RepID=UPI00226D5B62|nr:hypothetical protein [Pseudomonas sp. RtIB026]BDU10060.1 hypothetical protein PRtIB026_A49500 [Pseudomonas sp. RtIB026]
MAWLENAATFLSPGWVGSLIGLVGLIAIPIVYIKSRNRTRLSFAYLGEHLLGSDSASLPHGISVQYQGADIPRLTRSMVVLWNSGENTILGSDVVDADPLRVCVGSDGEILSASVIKETRSVNDFKIRPPSPHAPNEAIFEFNYFDSGDGVVVEILHTSQCRQPDLEGTLRRLPKGLKSVGRITRTPNILKRAGPSRLASIMASKVITWVPLLFGGAFILIALFASPETLNALMAFNLNQPSHAAMIMGVIYMAMGSISLYLFRRKHPKNLQVEALE